MAKDLIRELQQEWGLKTMQQLHDRDDSPHRPVSPYWRGRPVIDWSPTPWDPAAERVLTQAARITAVIVVGQRRIPTAEEVQRILALGDGTVESGSGTQALVEAVVNAEFWGPPATDPGWQLDSTSKRVVRLGRVRVTGIQPAVVLRHPERGRSFAHWSTRPFGSGTWAWEELNRYGLAVVNTRRLKPWRSEVRGWLHFGAHSSAITRRILPSHVRSAESAIRVEAFTENEQVRAVSHVKP